MKLYGAVKIFIALCFTFRSFAVKKLSSVICFVCTFYVCVHMHSRKMPPRYTLRTL